jgi:hypothetical protein
MKGEDIMTRLDDIHLIAQEKLQKQFSLNPVSLKHPLPERSLRALGLVKIDGKAFNSKEFLRVLLMNINVAFLKSVRTIFLGPRTDLDLPVFSTEVILSGTTRDFFLDVQRRGGYDSHDDTDLYNKLVGIKEKYPELFTRPLKQGREIDKTFSNAACYVKISRDQDEQTLRLFHEYLDVFLEMVAQAQPLKGEALGQAQRDYDIYTNTVVDHDPAAKVYRILFGKKGGTERVKELFFPKE